MSEKSIQRVQQNIKNELKDQESKNPSNRVDIEEYIKYIQSGIYNCK